MIAPSAASNLPLPRWAYVPGETDEAAADYETLAQVSALVPPRFQGYVPARHPALRYAITLNDRGYFWESQEIFEALWAAAPQGGRERILLRACILIATANLRLRMQKPHAAARLLGEGLGELNALGHAQCRWRRVRRWLPGGGPGRVDHDQTGATAAGQGRLGGVWAPSAEHETKCTFWHYWLDLTKNMHYCACLGNQAKLETTRENDRGWLMAGEDRVLAGGAEYIDFQTDPSRYRHWKLAVEGDAATLTMDVDENAGLFEGYQLKLNSYDLGVDIELADAVQRLRFEHPGVKVVVVRSGKNRVFCAGANIRMLAGSTHAHKVNFCKFTNETRNGLEDSSENSGQRFITVINGTAAGGGYELALATDHIILADDGAAAVSLPEVPLLAVLPGTGGLTRVVDKRKVRRDHADFFCTIEEGIKGKRAVQWRLVDEIAPNSKLETKVAERVREFAGLSKRNGSGKGIELVPITRSIDENSIRYGFVSVDIDRAARIATISIKAPEAAPPADIDGLIALGASFWPLQVARELDDAILHLRINELEIAMLLFKSHGERANIVACDGFLDANKAHWLVNEIRQYWKRVLKRIDVTSRTLVTLVEPGSCFVGTLAELVFAADRSYMLIGQKQGDNRAPPTIELTAMNFGPYPMSHGLTRLQSRFQADPSDLDRAEATIGTTLDAEAAEELGLVTFALDDVDWDDEVRQFLEERTSFSPDGLTGMEANLRFVGPETMESKIFSRLTAWQNWIFQRPNAVGENGALRRYGTGQKAQFDMTRV